MKVLRKYYTVLSRGRDTEVVERLTPWLAPYCSHVQTDRPNVITEFFGEGEG